MSSASDPAHPARSHRDRMYAARAAVSSANWPALAASVLVAVEGLVVLGLGGFQLVRGFGADIDDPVRAQIGAFIALVGGVGLLAAAKGLLLGRRWARSPVLVTQLISGPVAVALIQNDLVGYGAPLAVVAVVVVGLLLAAGVYGPPDDSAD